MKRTEEYYNNYEMIESKTGKLMLTKKDVGELLNFSQPTVRKRYGAYFSDGYISAATLATILSKKG